MRCMYYDNDQNGYFCMLTAGPRIVNGQCIDFDSQEVLCDDKPAEFQ